MTARDNACICTFEDGPREDCPACGRFPPEPSPALDNAETADLTLEVGSLREQLKESEGKCRALTVESEGWARQLTEATSLLARVDDALESDGPWLALQVQLRHWLASRTPAQPAAPMPEREYTWDGYALPMMTAAPEPSAVKGTREEWAAAAGREQVLRIAAEAQLAAVRLVRDKLLELAGEFRRNPQVHSTYSECVNRLDRALLTPAPSPVTAPEPSAEPVTKERYLLQCEVAESLRVKLLAAESQLSAVHDVAQRAEKRVELYPGLKGSTYYAAYLEILALLVRGATPAPSPGVDPGRSGK